MPREGEGDGLGFLMKLPLNLETAVGSGRLTQPVGRLTPASSASCTRWVHVGIPRASFASTSYAILRLPTAVSRLIGFVVLWAGLVHADVVPAFIFTDNAVLQRGKEVPVWGTAEAGEGVTVSFGGETVSTTTGESGRWQVKLPAMEASAEPRELVIQGRNTVRLANVLVGEVWLASGQSNMEWTMRRTYDVAIDVLGSVNYPQIRELRVGRKVGEEPRAEAEGKWVVASPETTAGFSAVGYYFARDVADVERVPVGIINSAWGGTRVEAWMDGVTLRSAPEFESVFERWAETLTAYPEQMKRHDEQVAAWERRRAEAQAAGRAFTARRPNVPQGPGHHATPAGLYNGMIAPLVPYALRGAIWYQGESNAGRAGEYRALFSAMIEGWRKDFGQGEVPFYWVQLANFRPVENTNWAFLREAQTQTLVLPGTGQAVTVDIGDVTDIHPRNKREVGRRLARLALARDYGHAIPDSGPVAERFERVEGGFRVTFGELHGGLIAPLNALSGFELAGEDREFKPATAKIEEGTVVVTWEETVEPVAVRYGWRNGPVAGLFNQEGLPAVPFRSDGW